MSIVLKKGDGNQAECPSCRSVIQFGPGDVARKKIGTDYDEGKDIFSYSISCPECKGVINISGKVTRTMQSRIDEVQRNRDLMDYEL